MIGEIATIIAPVLICAAIGLVWARRGHHFDAGFVTDLVMFIGAPCLVFHTLANLKVELAAFGTIAGAAIAAIALVSAVGAVGLRLAKLPLRAFLPALVFPNTGNMGLPLSYLAFGDTGLALAIAIFAVNAVGQFSFGVSIASGKLSFRSLLRIPLLYAVALALAFNATGTVPPKAVDETAKLLGGIAIPLMLVTLGTSLARLHVVNLRRSLAVAVFRLVLGFATGVVLAELFGLDRVGHGVLVVQSSMPVAVFSYLFAMRYETQPEDVAGAVVLSTLLAFAALPLLLWWVL